MKTYYGSLDPDYSEVDAEWDAFMMRREIETARHELEASGVDPLTGASPDWRPWDEDTDINLYWLAVNRSPESENWAVALS